VRAGNLCISIHTPFVYIQTQCQSWQSNFWRALVRLERPLDLHAHVCVCVCLSTRQQESGVGFVVKLGDVVLQEVRAHATDR
jgi:hypothetical protein